MRSHEYLHLQWQVQCCPRQVGYRLPAGQLEPPSWGDPGAGPIHAALGTTFSPGSRRFSAGRPPQDYSRASVFGQEVARQIADVQHAGSGISNSKARINSPSPWSCLLRKNEGMRHQLACNLVQTAFRKDDIRDAGEMTCGAQLQMRLQLAPLLRFLEIIAKFMETFHSAIAGSRSEHQLEFAVGR